jgi:hypothetical protein
MKLSFLFFIALAFAPAAARAKNGDFHVVAGDAVAFRDPEDVLKWAHIERIATRTEAAKANRDELEAEWKAAGRRIIVPKGKIGIETDHDPTAIQLYFGDFPKDHQLFWIWRMQLKPAPVKAKAK